MLTEDSDLSSLRVLEGSNDGKVLCSCHENPYYVSKLEIFLDRIGMPEGECFTPYFSPLGCGFQFF